MFLCVLLSYPGQSSSLDHVNSGYIRDVRFTVIYKLKQARLQATLSSHRRVIGRTSMGHKYTITLLNKCACLTLRGVYRFCLLTHIAKKMTFYFCSHRMLPKN